MKTYLFSSLLISGLFMISCATEQQESKIETTDTTSIQTTISQEDTSTPNGSIDTTNIKNSTNKGNSTIEKAQDIDNQISTKINKNNNPDNQNGNYNQNTENTNTSFIPVLSNEDKSDYFVKIFESPTKLSRQYFDKYFTTKQNVYVISDGGVYTYCIGKFKTQAEANTYLKEVKSKYKFKKCSVETFGAAF
jgi:hypothetical protein